MDLLFEALAFLIQAITIGGITAAILAVVGIVPIEINRYIEVYVSDEHEAAKVLKSLEIVLGETDSKDE